MAYKTRPGESQFQARQRIAREKGFASYRDYRTSSAPVRERSTRALAARRPDYDVRSATASIRRRASTRFVSAAGETLTSASVRAQYAHVRGADPDGVAVFQLTVLVGAVDRRRRDARRTRGRDSGYRTLQFTVPIADTDVDDGLGAFADWLDGAVDDALDALYSGGSGSGWTIDSMSVTV